jgi:hypothetical protein
LRTYLRSKNYTDALLERSGMTALRSAKKSSDPTQHLAKREDNEKLHDQKDYTNYLKIHMWPDISHQVNGLAKFPADPGA